MSPHCPGCTGHRILTVSGPIANVKLGQPCPGVSVTPEPEEIGDAVIYPPGSPEYEACTEYERDLIDTLIETVSAVDAWQRRAERAEDEALTLRQAHDGRAELVAALRRASDTIRVWHNIQPSFRRLKQAEIDEMWALYQHSPEMRQINAALAEWRLKLAEEGP